jgi:hypothetical protein
LGRKRVAAAVVVVVVVVGGGGGGGVGVGVGGVLRALAAARERGKPCAPFRRVFG